MANQIIPTNGNGNGTGKLAQFGDRDTVREMAERIQKMMPGTTNLNSMEALTVAQVAVAHGLDPFNGEVWGLKGENGKWYGVMVGIKGLRKCARNQAKDEGGVYWTEPPARVDPKKYNQPDGAIVYEIVLRDTVTMAAYGKSLKLLTDAGIPYVDAIAMIGKAPMALGVGIATPDERSKMSIHARAKKRAEAEAIRQRYDVELKGAQIVDDEELPDDVPAQPGQPEAEPVIEGVVNEHPEPKTDKPSEAQIMMELGYNR